VLKDCGANTEEMKSGSEQETTRVFIFFRINHRHSESNQK
jgi:hypothetical protein